MLASARLVSNEDEPTQLCGGVGEMFKLGKGGGVITVLSLTSGSYESESIGEEIVFRIILEEPDGPVDCRCSARGRSV